MGVTDEVDKLQCADGSFCLGDSSDYGSDSWQCCNEKGGRVGCPPNHPNLCAAENVCGNGTTLCCEKDCDDFDDDDDDDLDDEDDDEDDALDGNDDDDDLEE